MKNFVKHALLALCAAALAHSAAAQTAAPAKPAPAKPAASSPAATASSSAKLTTTVGTLDLLEGTVTVTSLKGSPRDTTLGMVLQAGDTIQTAQESEAHATMADGAYLAVRANTKIKITAYSANGNSRDQSWIDLITGSLRTVTGWIAKTRPKAYRINTPTATVGVRGTDHEVIFTSPEDADTEEEAGTQNVVYEGATTLETSKGKVDITFGQAAFIRPGEFIPQLYGKQLPVFLVRARGQFDNDVVVHRNNLDGFMQRSLIERGMMQDGQNLRDVFKRIGGADYLPGAGLSPQQNQQQQRQGIQSEILKNTFGGPGNVNEPLPVPFGIPGTPGAGGGGLGGGFGGGGGGGGLPFVPTQ